MCIRPDFSKIILSSRDPDVLVVADKQGRLHNGVVLHTNYSEDNQGNF